MRFTVTVRRIDDEPDGYGYVDRVGDPTLPAFEVQATDAEDAAELGHRIAGEGVRGITRTVATVADSDGDRATSTRWWLGGVETEPLVVKRSHAAGGDVLADGPGVASDADEVTWFTHDACVWLHVVRTARGRWRIDRSEFVRFERSHERKRFGTPDEALLFARTRVRGGAIVWEVEEW
jgi:hypothetical protein